MLKYIKILAPGRVCLFGDHQDYLGLPVIASAINRHIRLEAKINNTNEFCIEMPDINTSRIIKLSERFEKLEKRDYFASGIRVIRRLGISIDRGYDIRITGTIPINAGASSSSAFVSSWIMFLLSVFRSEDVNEKELSILTHKAETLEHNEPGGKMDQYSISTGGIVYIDTKSDYDVYKFKQELAGLILVNSMVPKDTLSVLHRVKSGALKAIDVLKKNNPGYNLRSVSKEMFHAHLLTLSEEIRPYYIAAYKNYHITMKAFEELKKVKLDQVKIAELMNEHHYELKENLKTTVPAIDDIISIAIKNGALSGKINGSGGGGTVLLYAPENRDRIAKILNEHGFPSVQINMDRGTRIEEME